jgi:UDP:flavonoid glycosyltransferase YjiC (YdhE family)
VFSEQPLDMEQARASCDLAVCHGGAGTTAAMLLAGKPLLLIPMQMEQTMTARRAEMLGAAVVVTDEHAGQMPRFLARAIKEPGLRDAARRFAERHAGYDQHATVRQARQQCEALMAGVSL